MMRQDQEILPELKLPKRFEILEQEAQRSGLDSREFIERVDEEAERIDGLLQNIKVSGCGQLELFLGLSGSGKTTFVSTLPKFFYEVEVYLFDKDRPLSELPEFVRGTASARAVNRIVLIGDRDNPKKEDLESAEETFDELRQVFRTPEGTVLALWPITHETASANLANIAWSVGRDSIVDFHSKGLHRFKGLPKERFFQVADTTSKNLSGDGLEAFGVTAEDALGLLPEAETITAFYYLLERAAAEVRGKTLSVLKKRVRPQVWVVLPGDIPASIDATVLSLTQGTRSRVDVDLLGEFIDNPSTEANYISDWRKRRSSLAHIMRALDVRLIGLPPNVSLAAIRAFGDDSTKKLLKQPSTNLSAAKNTMRRSRLYRAILAEVGIDAEAFSAGGKIVEETQNEYRRIQAKASSADASLNKALGQLIKATLEEDGIEASIIVEKQKLPGSRLRPDVQIEVAENSYICIEPTWRSTDKGIQGELGGGQNTLSTAHIKKYLLDKITEYVKDLDL